MNWRIKGVVDAHSPRLPPRAGSLEIEGTANAKAPKYKKKVVIARDLGARAKSLDLNPMQRADRTRGPDRGEAA